MHSVFVNQANVANRPPDLGAQNRTKSARFRRNPFQGSNQPQPSRFQCLLLCWVEHARCICLKLRLIRSTDILLVSRGPLRIGCGAILNVGKWFCCPGDVRDLPIQMGFWNGTFFELSRSNSRPRNKLSLGSDGPWDRLGFPNLRD
jgi:hypothetical protein